MKMLYQDIVTIQVPRLKERPFSTASAWSRIDLCFTLATALFLLIFTMSSLARVGTASSALVCMRNMQTISAAWIMYANDNQGLLVVNADSATAGFASSRPSWGGGWMDFTSSADNTNTAILQGLFNAYGGRLGPYVPDVRAYKCPEDRSTVTIGGNQFARVRSVSMNTYLSGLQIYNGNNPNLFVNSNYEIFMRKSDFADVNPSKIFLFIEERPESINDGVFALDMVKSMDLAGRLTPDFYYMVDVPGAYHENGAAISFIDGHAELWTWKDTRTTRLSPSINGPMSLNIPSPGNPDMSKIVSAMTKPK